jgi:hypothetical protein
MEGLGYDDLCQRREEIEGAIGIEYSVSTTVDHSIPPNHWDYVVKEAVSIVLCNRVYLFL